MKDALPITPSITIFGNPYKILNAKGQLMQGTNCRGGPPWPPQVCHIVFQRRGGHGGPPLQLLIHDGGDVQTARRDFHVCLGYHNSCRDLWTSAANETSGVVEREQQRNGVQEIACVEEG